MPGPPPLGLPVKMNPVHCLAEAPEPIGVLSQEAKQSLKEPLVPTGRLTCPAPLTAVISEEHSSWKAFPPASTILFLSSSGQATGNAVAVASGVPVDAGADVDELVAAPLVGVVADDIVLVVVVVVIVGANV